MYIENNICIRGIPLPETKGLCPPYESIHLGLQRLNMSPVLCIQTTNLLNIRGNVPLALNILEVSTDQSY